MRPKFHFYLTTALTSILMPSGCLPDPRTPPLQWPISSVSLPSQADWVDQGIFLEAGAEGAWDYYLWGGYAFLVIKKMARIISTTKAPAAMR